MGGGGEYKNPHRQRDQSLGLSILHLGPDFRARSFGQAVRKDASARYTAAWSCLVRGVVLSGHLFLGGVELRASAAFRSEVDQKLVCFATD